MRRISLLLLFCFIIFSVTGCVSKQNNVNEIDEMITCNEHIIEDIKERGYLIVGCKSDVPGLSYYNQEQDEWSGIEIEIAYKTAAKIFDVSVNEAKEQKLVDFKCVTVDNREEILSNGEIDCMLATYTITDERKKKYAFSKSYYTDYIGIMVRSQVKDSNSMGGEGIESIEDVDGKYIGVPSKATTRETFLQYVDSLDYEQISPIFCEYPSYQQLVRALKNGDIDAIAVDVSILNGYVDSDTTILDERFGGQKYGAAVLPENKLILNYVNQAIEQ